MSRRRFIASSREYEPPIDEEYERDLGAQLQLLTLLDDPSPAPPGGPPKPSISQKNLARMLSSRSVISTSSSFTRQQTRAHEESSHTQTFRKIGAGACGAVFAADGQSLAYKIGKAGTSNDDDALWTDFNMPQRILSALREYEAEAEIPTCHFFVRHDDMEWWNKHQNLATAALDTCHTPARVLITERVLPLPAPTRHELIQYFCKPNLRAQAEADPANRDCLVRLYLGSTRGRTTSFFSLRNFKLHLNQMIDIGLDYEAFAVSMGESLALIHWRARADARDIEFALGSSSTKSNADANSGQPGHLESGSSEATGLDADFSYCKTHLFVIDFNQVREMTMDEAGVDLAVEAFFLNDPYYPRPREDSKLQQELWNSFVQSYLYTAEVVLGTESEYRELPRKFISGVIGRVVQKTTPR